MLWLADRDWEATGIELSRVAVERARAAASGSGLPSNRAVFICDDLVTWADRPAEVDGSNGLFDLVTASFLQSPVELPRERILQAAASRVARGGNLVIVAHGSRPPWAEGEGHHHAAFPTPQAELETLNLDPTAWEVVTATLWSRAVTSPSGEPAELSDTVVIARRL